MSIYKFGYHFGVEIMNGLGLSIEAARWVVDEEGLGCCAFSGILIIVGCFVFTIGNPVDLEEIK